LSYFFVSKSFLTPRLMKTSLRAITCCLFSWINQQNLQRVHECRLASQVERPESSMKPSTKRPVQLRSYLERTLLTGLGRYRHTAHWEQTRLHPSSTSHTSSLCWLSHWGRKTGCVCSEHKRDGISIYNVYTSKQSLTYESLTYWFSTFQWCKSDEIP
jgi:hypothetical protein